MVASALAVYGKLPISKEFLRHACYEGVAGDFQTWINSGHDRSRAAGGEPPAQAGATHRVLCQFGKQREWVVGVLINSGDASGTRRFPFIVMTSLPRDVVNDTATAVSLGPVFDDLDRELHALTDLSDTDSFFQRARTAELTKGPLPHHEAGSELREFLEGPIQPWLEELYPEDAENLLVRGLWRLRSLLPSFDSGRGPQLGAVRVPLARSAPSLAQIDFWRSLLARLHSSFTSITTMFLPESADESVSAYLLSRPLAPEDYPMMVGAPVDPGRYTDITQAGERLPSEGLGAFRERVESGPLGAGANSRIQSLVSFDVKA